MAVNSTSNNSNTSGMYTKSLRMTGMSGIDTESIIKSIMKSESAPLYKLQQKKQMAEWKTTAYRDITSLLRGISDDYFSNTKMSSNLLSMSALKKYGSTSSAPSIVTASATSDASIGSHTIEVKQLATAASDLSTASITNAITGSSPVNVPLAAGKSFTMNLDGNVKVITISNTVTNTDELKADIQASLDTNFGVIKQPDNTEVKKVLVDIDGSGNISFSTANGATKLSLYGYGESDGYTQLGFTSSTLSSNRLRLNSSLSDLSGQMTGLSFNSLNNIELNINNQTFTFSSDTTLRSMMDQINSDSKAGVTMSYDEINDKIKIEAKQTGSMKTLDISENGSTFLKAAKIFTDTGLDPNAYTAGKDAIVLYDNSNTLTRSSNNILIDGVNYSLLKQSASGVSETITINQDVDSVYDNIKGFVDKYNDLISKINTKLSEKYDRDYQPLTSEQKSGMSDDEITKWETKAKVGILKSDSILQKIVTDMRTALIDKVAGTNLKLSDIGITTGDWQEKGKLSIDEEKLKKAIQNNPNEVANLFSAESDVTKTMDLTSEEKKERYNNEGIAYRISDIIQDNIRTGRDKHGKAGTLLEKAGMEGNLTEYTSTLYKEIYDYTSKMADLEDILEDKETQLYNKYSKLESYISKMNNQSSWLSSQLGSGS